MTPSRQPVSNGMDKDEVAAPTPLKSSRVVPVWVQIVDLLVQEGMTLPQFPSAKSPSLAERLIRRLARHLPSVVTQSEIVAIENRAYAGVLRRIAQRWAEDSDSVGSIHFLRSQSDYENLLSHPVVVRRIAQIVCDEVDAFDHLIQSLEASHHTLGILKVPGRKSVVLESYTPGLGESHDQGRSTCEIVLSGVKLAWKPRANYVYGHISQLFKSLALLDHRLKLPYFHAHVPLGAGQLEEWINASYCSTSECLRDFYKRVGALLGIAQICGVRDLHGENLIPTNSGPVVVDWEVAFASQPDTGRKDELSGRALGILAGSAHDCALIPSYSAKGGLHSYSYEGAVPSLARLATDGLCDPAPERTDKYIEFHLLSILAGFRSVWKSYRLPQATHLLKATAEAVRNLPVRFVPRHTDLYMRVLQALPLDEMTDMAAFEWVLEKALRESAGPVFRELVSNEARSLAIGEIPFFQTLVGTNQVSTPGGRPFQLPFRPYDLDLFALGRPDCDLELNLDIIALTISAPTLDDRLSGYG
jgi:hypothetical protein